MKLRIKGNSIRLRITKTDLEKLRQDGHITEFTHFGSATLSYRLCKDDMVSQMQAQCDNGNILVSLPSTVAHELLNSDQISFQHTQETNEAGGLFILVEKDFKCLDATREDQSDMWDNPNDKCQPPAKP